MLIKYKKKVISMEQWKMSILIGIALIVLGIIFIILRGHISIWLAIVLILGIIDIAWGIFALFISLVASSIF